MEVRPPARPRRRLVTRAYVNLPSLDIARGPFALRPVNEGDIESIRQWRNAQMEVLRQAGPITPAMQRRYFCRAIWPQMERKQPDTVLLAVECERAFVGYGGLVHCQWQHRRAEVSILFAPAIAADAPQYRRCLLAFLAMIDELAFDRLRLGRLTLETYDIRPFHVAVIEEAGYSREGRLRQHVTIGGNRFDSLLHGRLARDRQREIGTGQPAGGRMTSNATRSILTPAAGGR